MEANGDLFAGNGGSMVKIYQRREKIYPYSSAIWSVENLSDIWRIVVQDSQLCIFDSRREARKHAAELREYASMGRRFRVRKVQIK